MLRKFIYSISEEILHSNVAHWWSPDSRHVVYATFDDSQVPRFKFPKYGPGEAIYGYIEEIAYPKVGTRCSFFH